MNNHRKAITTGNITVNNMTSFFVAGIPVSQGSHRALMPKGGKYPIILADNREKLNNWRASVAYTALREGIKVSTEPLTIHLEFVLPRPISLPRRVQFPAKKPDLDKLVRAVFDALTGVAFKDDSQIIFLTAEKRYAAADEPTGCKIEIQEGKCRAIKY